MSGEATSRMGKSSERLPRRLRALPVFSCAHYFQMPFHGPLGRALPLLSHGSLARRNLCCAQFFQAT